MAIEVQANNPLGLTDPGASGGLYPGQVGDLTSGLGYTFATFATPAAGIAAGIDYITRHIQSGAATTVQQLVDLFSPNDLPAFEATTGLASNSPLNASQAGTYAAGIAAGEGTLQSFGGTSAFTSNASAATGSWSDWLNQLTGGWSGLLGGPPAGQSSTAAINPAQTPSNIASGTDPLTQFLAAASQNIVFVVVGIVLLLGTLYMLAVQAGAAPSPKEIGKAAAAGGAAVVAA